MVEIEYFSLTGMQGNTGETGMLYLKMLPSTGPNGVYDVAVDPSDGPAQTYNIDFGVTASSLTGAVFFDLVNSDIKDVLMDYTHGVTGPLFLRVLYNGYTGM